MDNAPERMNEPRTCTETDAGLTPAGSLDVHAIPETIGALTAMRTRHGADSPIGHHCSNIIKMLQNLDEMRRPDLRVHLKRSIKQQVTGLAALTDIENLPLKSLGRVSH